MTDTNYGPLAELDHLVIAAATLAQGVDFVEQLTGVTPSAGGRHDAMGTHNALLRLGERLYLEIIAIDPDGTKPARPRWFELDEVAMRGEIAERPRLVHWLARTKDIDRALTRVTIDPGRVHPMARGAYRWRITIPDDGHRPAKGLFPGLIQWDVPEHPADALPEKGVRLEQFAAAHPEPAIVRKALGALGLGNALTVTYGRLTRLAAMLRTPRGLVTI